MTIFMMYWRNWIKKISIRNRVSVILFLMGVLILSLSYQKNFFGLAHQEEFINFERFSESLVLGAITADKQGLDKQKFHLGFIAKNKNVSMTDLIRETYDIFGHENKFPDLIFIPYKSQFGLHGIFYSEISSIFSVLKFNRLQYISSLLFSFAVMWLVFLYARIYDRLFALIFFVVFATSPWIIIFAKNLYWSPVTWILPAIFSAKLYLTKNRFHRTLLYSLIGLSVFIKSLCGYEYLSTIVIFTLSVFLLAPFFKADTPRPRPDIKTCFWVGVMCLSGFVFALMVHASIRGDNIMAGLSSIYELDVMRRTYGDPNMFDPVLRDSLRASPLSVLKIYIFNWSKPLILGIHGGLFSLLIAFALMDLVIRFFTKNPTFKRDGMVFLVMASAPLSWFILAKAHSSIHHHLNFVLWYYGFVPALLYVCFNHNSLLCTWAVSPKGRNSLGLFSRWLKEKENG